MKIGGEGIETKVINDCLYIKAENRMVGYLNAPSPFDKEGWYCTKDIVEIKDNNFRHAILACTTKYAHQVILNQYLELNQ